MHRLLHSILAFALLLSAACGEGDEERNEARLFLDRVAQLDVDEHEERERRIRALEQMPLAHERVKQVRDHCVRLHRALLTAEATNDDAYASLTELQAESAERSDGGVDGGVDGGAEENVERAMSLLKKRAAIEQQIARSTRAVSEAAAARAPCQDGVAQLRARYLPRR